ncbi:c-type cytochrome [Pontibacter sp. JAM-7]|uniref:c-type cytochrome n=1 Tax=Pontibacter sp. JAM-7 TaxID=3366581 RepID=UPI003AF61897
MLRINLGLLCGTLLFLGGCGTDDPRKMTSGEELYQYYCQSCHAKGNPGAHFELSRTHPPLQSHQVLLLFRYGYRAGDEVHQMPQFDLLNDQQSNALTEYVVKLLHQPNTSD